MAYRPLVTIIINNFNYARFLSEAITTAIEQTYPLTEVIVVDDGSTDNSREIITTYDDKVISIFKENKGQSSTLNAGFTASKGEIICFLDADDIFSTHKVSQVVELFEQIQQSDILLFHEMEAIDENSKFLKINRKLNCELSDLNYRRAVNLTRNQRLIKICTSEEVYQHAVKYRYIPYLAAPTSGLILDRSLASKIFPLPEKGIKTSADEFVVKAASLLGEIYYAKLSLSGYRIHGNNSWYGRSQPHQKEFLQILDCFLNSKLESIQKRPVLSYFDSLRVKTYYKSCYFEKKERFNILKTSFKVVAWHTNFRTIKFLVKSVYKFFELITFDLINRNMNIKKSEVE